MGGRFVGRKSKYVSATTATWLVCLAVCMTGVLTQVQAQFSMSDIYNITEVDDVKKWCYDYGIDPNKLSISIETANKEYEPIKDKYSGFRATLDIIINNRTSKEDASKAKRDLVLKSQAGAMIIIGALGLLSLLIILIWGIWVLARRGHCCCKKAEAIVDNEPLTFKEILSKWKGKLVIGSTSVLFVAMAVFAILWTIEAQSLGTRVKEVRCAAAVFYSDATGGKRVQVGLKNFMGIRGFIATFQRLQLDLMNISKINAAATKLATNFPQLNVQSTTLSTTFDTFKNGYTAPTYLDPQNAGNAITPTVFTRFQESIANSSLSTEVTQLSTAGTSVSSSLSASPLGVLQSVPDMTATNEVLLNKTIFLQNITNQLLDGQLVPAFNESLYAETIQSVNVLLIVVCMVTVFLFVPVVGVGIVCMFQGGKKWVKHAAISVAGLLILLGALLLFYSSGLYLATVGAYWGCSYSHDWLNTRDSWFNGMGYLLKFQDPNPVFNECIYKDGAGQFLNALALDMNTLLSKYATTPVNNAANNLVSANTSVGLITASNSTMAMNLSETLNRLQNGTDYDRHGGTTRDQYFYVNLFNSKKCSQDQGNLETPGNNQQTCRVPGYALSSTSDMDTTGLGSNFCFNLGNFKASGYPARYATLIGQSCGSGEPIVTVGQNALNDALTATTNLQAKVTTFKTSAFAPYDTAQRSVESAVRTISPDLVDSANGAVRIASTVRGVLDQIQNYATCNYLHVDTLRMHNTVCYGLSPNTDSGSAFGFIFGILLICFGSATYWMVVHPIAKSLEMKWDDNSPVPESQRLAERSNENLHNKDQWPA